MEISLENLHVDIGTKRVNTSSHPGNEDPTLASEKCSFEHHQEGILHLFKPDWIGLWVAKLMQSFVSISQIWMSNQTFFHLFSFSRTFTI